MDDGLGQPQSDFSKIDTEEDEVFYEPPRLVCHIDDGAIAALTQFYRRILPAGGVLLDLMSSWVSHLPPEIEYAEVIG
ncbi:MAG: SAM-dependent methyltransferase, partial [Stellaceae bacterium]